MGDAIKFHLSLMSPAEREKMLRCLIDPSRRSAWEKAERLFAAVAAMRKEQETRDGPEVIRGPGEE